MAHIAIDARIISSSTGRYVERLVTYLQDVDTKNKYSILVREKDRDYWKPKSPNFEVLVAEYDQYSFAEQLGFYVFIKKLRADLVHFCMPQQPILYNGPKVTTFHDLSLLNTYNTDKNWFIYHAKQAVGRKVFKKVAESNDQIIAISDYTKNDLLETFPTVDEKKITTIYEASDVGQVAPRKYSLPFKNYILYVGSQSDYKNISRLTDAHQVLLAKYPKLGLVLAGKKNAAALKTEAHVMKRKYKNVVFTDFVDDRELSWLYSHADAYVFPSLMEGFGLPGLEAMEHGTPVVSSNATCLPEVYGQAAHYFTPTDTSDMADAIDQVLADEKLRTRLSKAGFKQIKKYSWKKMASQTHKVYESVLKNLPEQS